MAIPPSLFGPLAALMTSVTWVIGSSAYTRLSRSYHPTVINFNRAMMAFPLFILCCIVDWPEIRNLLQQISEKGDLYPRLIWLGTSILSSYLVADIFFIWGSLSIGFPAAQAIGGLYPLWASLSGTLLLNRPPTRMESMGMLLALLGTLLIVFLGKRQSESESNLQKEKDLPPHLSFLRDYRVGVLLSLGASLFWALNSFAVTKGGHGLSPFLVNVIRMGTAVTVCFCLITFRNEKVGSPFFKKEDYLKYWPLLVLETFGGGLFYIYGMTNTSLTVGATLTSLAPVFAVPLAIFMGWEKFSLIKAMAIMVVVVGSILMVC